MDNTPFVTCIRYIYTLEFHAVLKFSLLWSQCLKIGYVNLQKAVFHTYGLNHLSGDTGMCSKLKLW